MLLGNGDNRGPTFTADLSWNNPYTLGIQGILKVNGICSLPGPTGPFFGIVAIPAGNTASVSTTAIRNDSMIFLTGNTGSVQGSLYVSYRDPGVEFYVQSSSGTDIGNIAWMIINPS
ncbi:MAG: hypothetical protein EBT86_00820 [Actinobacteria bacterium]|nr:hypothetical protein [Actinomycetota bacterium]